MKFEHVGLWFKGIDPWHLAMAVLLAVALVVLAVQAADQYRWSDWGFGDAQTMLSLRQWEEGGWFRNYFLFKPQGYAKVIDLFDDPELRHHAHGTCPGSSPRVGPRLWYTHYPAGYLIPYAALFRIGLDSLFSVRMLSLLFSMGALVGLWIFNLGMLFTFLTSIFLPDKPILFGVLHCIGCCIILSTLLLKLKSTNIILAVLVIVSGLALGFFYTNENPNIVELASGIHESDVGAHTIDYFPILPWFGVCLLGITLGNFLYKDNKRRYHLPDLSKYRSTKIFSWLGQHSLLIYLIHQPIIAGILFCIVMV